MKEHTPHITILMADDDEDDRFFAQEAMEEIGLTGTLHCVNDGEELMDYLYRRGQYIDPKTSPRPGLILLDLNMPKKDGREALQEIKSDSSLCQIPVVVLTSSSSDLDVRDSYQLGANTFITKPVTFEGLVEMMKTLGEYWLSVVKLPLGES